MGYSHSHRDGFTETGVGALNLVVKDQDEDPFRTKLGVGISHILEVGKKWQLVPSARIAYVREHMDRVSSIEAGFAGAPNATFAVDGPELDQDRMALNMGVVAGLNERSQFYLGYDAELADSDTHHVFSATYRYQW
ncbi:MAG: autotransporter outer membrane beta-barrel domain-containing protein [Desulfobacterales bacterium]|nr:autotransporter outer membrane beta-barrel domain-containing protein [Desulfobacterales bacterium]